MQPQFPVIKKIRMSFKWRTGRIDISSMYGKARRSVAAGCNQIKRETALWQYPRCFSSRFTQLTGMYDALRPQILRNMTERCSLLPRCWVLLVYHSATLVDARLTNFTTYKDKYMLSPMIEYKSEQISMEQACRSRRCLCSGVDHA